MQSRYKRKNQDFTGNQQDIKALQAENTRFKEYLQNAQMHWNYSIFAPGLKNWKGITLKQDLEALNNIHSNYIAGSNTHQSDCYRGPGAKKTMVEILVTFVYFLKSN